MLKQALLQFGRVSHAIPANGRTQTLKCTRKSSEIVKTVTQDVEFKFDYCKGGEF